MKSRSIGTLVVVGLVAWAGAAQASLDYFLKLDGIDGESTDDAHPKWVEPFSFSWGVTNAGSPVIGGGTGKPSFSDFAWTQNIDSSIPKFFTAVASGKHLKDATFEVVKGGDHGGAFFRMIFRDVLGTGLRLGGGGDLPMASESIAYSFVELQYRPQKADGSFGAWIKGSYDLKKAKVEFIGDPLVILGLFQSGGNVTFDMPGVPAPVPEPASYALFGAGLLVVGVLGRRRRHR